MSNGIDTVARAEAIKRIVARSIASKAWRSSCVEEALGYAAKTERKTVEQYVRAEYDAAGAGFSGRWQS